MSDFIDFQSYDLHGDELLVASAIVGLYAMMVTGNYCGSKEDFKNWLTKKILLTSTPMRFGIFSQKH